MPKSMNQAILEAIQGEMRRDKLLTLLYEYQKPGNLEAEFGPWRVRFCAIDEEWIVGGVLGMSMIGVPAIAHIPSMATFIPSEPAHHALAATTDAGATRTSGFVASTSTRFFTRLLAYGLA